MLLVYTHKITPRVRYIYRQLCTHILGVEVDFTSKIEVFVAHQGAKLSYGKQPLGKELFIESASLLFESGYNALEIEVQKWENTYCFFPSRLSDAGLPYDIFAASFYLLTRYEEYFPHVKDEYGRFMATESLAYKNGFLQQPVVDIWALEFKKILLSRFPNLQFNSKRFSVRPIVSVSQAFAYRERGVLRTLGGVGRDLSKFRFKRISSRFKVLLGLKKDPFNTFDFILNFQRANKKKIIFLFGLGDYSNFEKSVGSTRSKHRELIKSVADYAEVGLRVSYGAIDNVQVLKEEKSRLESITHKTLEHTQSSYYKLNLPEAYRNLVEMEVGEDYSMGYPNNAGFRAGTCSPFLFYDLDYEVQTPLWVYSFCFTNNAFKMIAEVTDAKQYIEELLRVVKRVDGLFIPVFSNGLFVATKRGLFWRAIFEFIWKSTNV